MTQAVANAAGDSFCEKCQNTGKVYSNFMSRKVNCPKCKGKSADTKDRREQK